MTSLVGTVGLKAHKVTDKGTPMISFAVNNEFGDTQITVLTLIKVVELHLKLRLTLKNLLLL